MIFWFGILLALITTALTAKKGLFETWTLFFNVVMAVYLALTLGPVLKGLLGVSRSGGEALVMLGTAVACLTVLYIFSYVIFLSQFHVTLPKALDIAGGGLFGFLTGFLAWSFIAFLIFISPLSLYKVVNKIGFNSTSTQSCTGYMKWWTGVIHAVVSEDGREESIDQKLAALGESADKAIRAATTVVEPNEPPAPAETITVEKEITPADLGPPPELNFEDI